MSVISSGVSHDVFMGVLGSLIVVSLLLVFAIIFICTRSAHRLARAADSKTRLYSMMTPDTARYPYHAINPLEDELESGNKHRATAHSNAQAMSGAAQLAHGADSSSNSSSRSGSGGSTRGSGSGSRPLRTTGNAPNSGGAATYGSVL